MSASDESFASKLMGIVGGRYSPAMRRSVQTVVLYEANRCLKDRYSTLRPFQRKIALYDTASDIINTLSFIPPYHRIEILFRTASGKVPLSPDLAWRRMKLIDREIQKTIVPKIRPFLDPEKGHGERCDSFIQSQYEAVSGIRGKRHPVVWEYSHLNIFLAYRMFYKGEDVDPNLPVARDPNPHRVVPNKKPVQYPPDPTMGAGGEYDSDGSESGTLPKDFGGVSSGGGGGGGKRGRNKRKARNGGNDGDEQEIRCAMLREVRDHLEILKEFEGIIPLDELNRRKRQLFLSLPSAPPTTGTATAMASSVGAKQKRQTPPPTASVKAEAKAKMASLAPAAAFISSTKPQLTKNAVVPPPSKKARTEEEEQDDDDEEDDDEEEQEEEEEEEEEIEEEEMDDDDDDEADFDEEEEELDTLERAV